MENFIEKLEEILERESGSIHPSDLFRNYEEWDSLALLSLMVMLEEHYNKTIPRNDFESLNTVKELFDYVN